MASRQQEHSTRTRVLAFVKVNGRVTIQRISEVLGVSAIAVRGQLRRLKKAGLLWTEREHRSRGRPADLFRLTDLGDRLFPKAYDRVAVELLRSLATVDGAAKVDRLFQEREDRRVAQYSPRMIGKDWEGRVHEVIRIFCEEGHMAESRALEARTVLVTIHNCLIPEIARQYPQACQSDLCFLARVLEADAHREHHVMKGDPECSYLVRFPNHRKLAVANQR